MTQPILNETVFIYLVFHAKEIHAFSQERTAERFIESLAEKPASGIIQVPLQFAYDTSYLVRTKLEG